MDGRRMIANKQLALSSLFGLLIFFQKMLMPSPYDKLVSILLQITLLSLVFLFAGLVGTMLTSSISALLTASIRGELLILTISMAMIYGVLVSVFNHVLRVAESDDVSTKKLMISTFASSLVMGILSSTVSISLRLIPYNFFVFSAIMMAGAIQGVIGGYFTGLIWNRYAKHLR
jgi:hypothetical protein